MVSTFHFDVSDSGNLSIGSVHLIPPLKIHSNSSKCRFKTQDCWWADRPGCCRENFCRGTNSELFSVISFWNFGWRRAENRAAIVFICPSVETCLRRKKKKQTELLLILIWLQPENLFHMFYIFARNVVSCEWLWWENIKAEWFTLWKKFISWLLYWCSCW